LAVSSTTRFQCESTGDSVDCPLPPGPGRLPLRETHAPSCSPRVAPFACAPTHRQLCSAPSLCTCSERKQYPRCRVSLSCGRLAVGRIVLFRARKPGCAAACLDATENRTSRSLAFGPGHQGMSRAARGSSFHVLSGFQLDGARGNCAVGGNQRVCPAQSKPRRARRGLEPATAKRTALVPRPAQSGGLAPKLWPFPAGSPPGKTTGRPD